MKLLVLLLLLSIGVTAQARDGDMFNAPFVSSISPALSTFYTSYCGVDLVCQGKIILDAREDAATFIGSNGEVRGAQLEQAILFIRDSSPEVTASDMELALEILSKTN